MERQPFFTIIMPTYNSMPDIKVVLDALQNQSIAKEDVELLVVDGGSTDETVEVAKSAGATIIHNPKRLPEYAKALGMQHARGRFIVKLDSDEELVSGLQLEARKDFLLTHEGIKVMLADCLLTPKGSKVSTAYLNALGDPFTYFCYKSKGSVRKTFKRHLGTKRGEEAILTFKEGDILPIGDSGSTTISMDYMRNLFPTRIGDVDFACSCFNDVLQETLACGCIEGDDIIHHSSAGLRTYLKKLDFRVLNNLFHKEESGFSNREASSPLLRRRKLLFVPYAGLVLPVLLDSAKLALVHKNRTFLLHAVYVYYIIYRVLYHVVVSKVLGKRVENAQYGD